MATRGKRKGGASSSLTAKRQRPNGGAASPVVPEYPFETVTNDSRKLGEHALEWLLEPLQVKKFFAEVFEKEPKLLNGHDNPGKFESLISLDGIKKLICNGKGALEYGVDVDVTRYTVEHGRTTFNGTDESAAEKTKKKENNSTKPNQQARYAGVEAWKQFETGASIRLRQPQTHFDAIYRLCAHIEEFLECIVGANVYLTPVDHQGFAPHFDDIDAFICQIAGCKRWKVYAPRGDGLDDLPRGSSIDFNADDMSNVQLIMDTVLKPGDMLYLPRGTIHEAVCVSEPRTRSELKNTKYSLHVTVSMFQKWTWADFLENSIITAVRSAAAQDRTLRRTLPLRFGRFSGAQNPDTNEKLRDWFHNKVVHMVGRVARSYPTDAAADGLMQEFMRTRLPPPPRPPSALLDKNTAKGKTKQQDPSTMRVKQDSYVRAVSAGAARIVIDSEGATEGLPRIVTCVRNNRTRQVLDLDEEASMSCLPEEAKAVDCILKVYPKSMRVSDILLEDKRDRVDLVLALASMGIVEQVDK